MLSDSISSEDCYVKRVLVNPSVTYHCTQGRPYANWTQIYRPWCKLTGNLVDRYCSQLGPAPPQAGPDCTSYLFAPTVTQKKEYYISKC